METTLYISGIISGLLLMGLLRFRHKYIMVNSENNELKSNNRIIQKELDEILDKHQSKLKRGLYKRTTTHTDGSTGAKRTVHWTLEVEEVAKTNKKSKVIIHKVKADDINEKVTIGREQRIRDLTGEWLPSHKIEWFVNKTPQEQRTDKIDDILESEEK